MNWIGEIFKLVGGGSENIQETRAREAQERNVAGKMDQSKRMEYMIFFSLLGVFLILAAIQMIKK